MHYIRLLLVVFVFFIPQCLAMENNVENSEKGNNDELLTTLDKYMVEAFVNEIPKKIREAAKEAKNSNYFIQSNALNLDNSTASVTKSKITPEKKSKATRKKVSKKRKCDEAFEQDNHPDNYFGIIEKNSDVPDKITFQCTICSKIFQCSKKIEDQKTIFDHLHIAHETKAPIELSEIFKKDENKFFNCIFDGCNNYFDQPAQRTKHHNNHVAALEKKRVFLSK